MLMIYRRDRPSLTFEPLGERTNTRLDGDQPIETRVSRLPDLTHAAGTEGGENLVRTEPRSWSESHLECREL
jgi:hypothetical protein